jgi:hypothetical protein
MASVRFELAQAVAAVFKTGKVTGLTWAAMRRTS